MKTTDTCTTDKPHNEKINEICGSEEQAYKWERIIQELIETTCDNNNCSLYLHNFENNYEPTLFFILKALAESGFDTRATIDDNCEKFISLRETRHNEFNDNYDNNIKQSNKLISTTPILNLIYETLVSTGKHYIFYIAFIAKLKINTNGKFNKEIGDIIENQLPLLAFAKNKQNALIPKLDAFKKETTNYQKHWLDNAREMSIKHNYMANVDISAMATKCANELELIVKKEFPQIF
jgi:hypothetical protein